MPLLRSGGAKQNCSRRPEAEPSDNRQFTEDVKRNPLFLEN